MKQAEQSRGMNPEDSGRGRWLVASFLPVTLFSLRMTHATSKGGKTLVVPTPYAIKMALIDASFRRWDREEAERKARAVFNAIKWREIRILPPSECVVQHTFVKVLDHARDQTQGPYKSTIAYREFVFFSGELHIAVGISGLDDPQVSMLTDLFSCINTFGKRGSFWQFREVRTDVGELPGPYTTARDALEGKDLTDYLITQVLDDFGEALCKARDGFDRMSTFGSGTITLDAHRVLRLTGIPYRRITATRRATRYTRTDAGTL